MLCAFRDSYNFEQGVKRLHFPEFSIAAPFTQTLQRCCIEPISQVVTDLENIRLRPSYRTQQKQNIAQTVRTFTQRHGRLCERGDMSHRTQRLV